ncbi:hypothetical protein EDC94DRAFT_620197 [Helicostylum pulchrum]|nr:hypothetical protein EDC94DRAFT_620197 [Helicostylum pulchrum]
MNKIFINEVKTDEYTCHFTFARIRTENPMVKLELQGFTQDEIDLYFRPCTINPGRNHVFTSFRGDNEIRRMSTKEFYSYGGTIQHLKFQQERPKTSKNKRRRRNNRKNRLVNAPVLPSASAPVTTPFSRHGKFKKFDNGKMPLVIFGDGMFNKDGVHFKGHQHGITSIVYKNLRRREKLGELCLLDINEFRTSVVCNTCKTKSNVRLQSNNKVLCCTNCRTLLWNRDTDASKNMWDICSSVWSGSGRPGIFCRSPSSEQQ